CARVVAALRGAGLPGAGDFSLAPVNRASCIARFRRRRALETPRPPQPPDGAAGFAPSLAVAGDRTIHAMDHAPGLRRGILAAAQRRGGTALAYGNRRDGSVVLSREPCLRASGRRISGIRGRVALPRSPSHRPSFYSRRPRGAK